MWRTERKPAVSGETKPRMGALAKRRMGDEPIGRPFQARSAENILAWAESARPRNGDSPNRRRAHSQLVGNI